MIETKKAIKGNHLLEFSLTIDPSATTISNGIMGLKEPECDVGQPYITRAPNNGSKKNEISKCLLWASLCSISIAMIFWNPFGAVNVLKESAGHQQLDFYYTVLLSSPKLLKPRVRIGRLGVVLRESLALSDCLIH